MVFNYQHSLPLKRNIFFRTNSNPNTRRSNRFLNLNPYIYNMHLKPDTLFEIKKNLIQKANTFSEKKIIIEKANTFSTTKKILIKSC